MLTLLSLLWLCGPSGALSAVERPRVGLDPVPSVTVVENHATALSHWSESGFSGATLLHVDLHDDLRPADAGGRSILSEGRKPGALAPSEPRYDEGNFLRAAIAERVVKDICWIVPFPFMDEPSAESQLRSYLHDAGFAPRFITSLRPSAGCFSGKLGKTPLSICSISSMPPLGSPLLLSIDTDFFPYFSASRGTSFIHGVKLFFDAVKGRRYRPVDVVLSYSVDGEYVPVQLRWVGDMVLALLRRPDLLSRAAPPESWTVYERAFYLSEQARYDDFRLFIAPHVRAHPGDPVLLFFMAESQLHRGEVTEALQSATAACEADAGYCYGLHELGVQALVRGDYAAGAPFFTAAEHLAPGSKFRVLDRALALHGLGRHEEARELVEEDDRTSGNFTYWLISGRALFEQGSRSEAFANFGRAVGLIQNLFPGQTRQFHAEVREAIAFAARACRDAGLPDQADRLESLLPASSTGNTGPR